MPVFAAMISRACFALALSALLCGWSPSGAQAQSADTSFFVTSTGIGNGGNLGGLAGADNHCQTLAQAAGAARGSRPGAPISRPRPPTASPR